uniref:ZP domain-containing protein n=1 Tax=Panagrellus redivivus TaxID=6233 RepID=A0A7E4VGA8_PANRE
MATVKWRIVGVVFAILCSLTSVNSVSIDNDIIGEPDIECLDQEIRVFIKTRKVFAGRIYAKGKADDPDCAKDDFDKQRTKKPHFDLSLGMCGMKSLRSFDPRGMYYGITLVVSFHPLFITKVDQAFHVKCFFEEANRGLTAELGVSMIPTTELEARHGIPGCTYSIHRASIEDLDAGRPAGPAIQFAKIGEKVLHQWHCDDQMFGVLINNCYVTDGVNKRVEVIDSRGCPIEQLVITGIRYSDDLQRAYAESQVFKFADRPGIWFFCQIQMCMKGHGMCDGITPPACAEGGGTKPRLIGSGEDDDGEDFPAPKKKSKKTKGNRPRPSSNTDSEDFSGNDDYVQAPTSPYKPKGGSGNGSGRGRGGGSRPPSNTDYDASDEEVEENFSAGNRETYSTPRRPKTYGGEKEYDETNSNKVSTIDEDDDDEPTSKKGHIPGYGLSTDLDYETKAKEAVTVFGPAIAPDAGTEATLDPVAAYATAKVRSEIVSTDFEADDDLIRTTAAAPTKPGGSKKDYVDYESDVTIPPNLTDLLANLPEDINADSLQKMFRDSVADRRALLQGFDMLMNKMGPSESPKRPAPQRADGRSSKKHAGRRPGEKIDTMHVTWDNGRLARDLPISSIPNPMDYTTVNPNDPPMIAGQLLIYDLDETPPDTTSDADELNMPAADCAISRQGLLVLAMCLAGTTSIMLFVIVALTLKLRRQNTDKELLLERSSNSSSTTTLKSAMGPPPAVTSVAMFRNRIADNAPHAQSVYGQSFNSRHRPSS